MAFETATIVVTDIVDSTGLRSRLGDDAADDIGRAHDRIVEDAVAAHGGVVVKGRGDGFLLRFSSGVNALNAAVAVQQGLANWNSRGGGPPILVRIGVSAGDVRLEDGDVHGTPVVEAARLEPAAAPGEILCSEIVRVLAGSRGAFRYEDRGDLELKGLPAPVRVFAIDWEPAADELERDLPTRPEVFVGREALVDEMVGGVSAQPVQLLVGQAGAGKSSILAEALHRLAPTSITLFGRGDDLFTEGFAAIRQVLAQLQSTPGSEIQALFGGDAAGDGVDATPDRLATFESARRALAEMARSRAIVIGIDDGQWLDDGSALFLRTLAFRPVPGLSLMIACRPWRADTDSMALRVLDDLRRFEGATLHEVEPLSRAAIAELGARLNRPLNDAEVDRLAAAGGNALVVSELIRHSEDLVEIPRELSSFFERRLSTLPVLARDVLATASLLPDPLDVAVLAQVVEASPVAVLSELHRVADLELLVGSPVGGFRFRHALVRDAVAATVTGATRLRLQLEAARVLRRMSADATIVADLVVAASTMADPTEVVEACRLAGERSAAVLAHEDAARYFGRALAHLDAAAPLDERFELTLAHAEALSAAWRWGDASTAFASAVDLAHELADPVAEADAVIKAFGSPENYSWGDSLPAGLDRAIESLGELDGDRQATLLAIDAIGAWDQWRLEEANDLLRRAESLASSLAARGFVIRCHLRSWFDPSQTDSRCRLADQLVELGRRSSDPTIRAYGHRWGVITGFDAADLAGVEGHLDALYFLAQQERDLWHEWFVLTRRVALGVARGRFDIAEAALASSAELAEILETPYVNHTQAGVEFLVSSLRGRPVPDRARAVADTQLFVRMSLATGDDVADTSIARGALDVLHPRSLAGRLIAVLAAPLALSSGDPELARRTIEALSGLEDGFAVVPPGVALLGSVRQRLGYCHLALEQPETALADFSAAATSEREVGALTCAARSEWLAGHALRLLGDDVAAEERQAAARATAVGLGLANLSDAPLPGSEIAETLD